MNRLIAKKKKVKGPKKIHPALAAVQKDKDKVRAACFFFFSPQGFIQVRFIGYCS
jgi:hypothetical protein